MAWNFALRGADPLYACSDGYYEQPLVILQLANQLEHWKLNIPSVEQHELWEFNAQWQEMIPSQSPVH